mmetsp:Transcript_24890/g.32425  ORF Transcript_24890/g.32425 Transcript_24890/m.32425 type:complete len:497 (-) Transcript_24890:92-1582(-)
MASLSEESSEKISEVSSQPQATDEDKKAKSEALKNQGNERLKVGLFNEAIELYSEGIALHETAVLYANRSMAQAKLESYGLAIADAGLALEIDPNYVKAYYRRASGNFALGKYKLALKDFRHVCKLEPKDKQARMRLKECDKAAKAQSFAEAIESEETAPFVLDVEKMEVESSYNGPHIEGDVVTLDFVHAMIERFKDQKMIHRKYVAMILNQVSELFGTLPNCLPLKCPTDSEAPFTVCGDVHGQFYDLLNIFSLNGEPSEERPYLFNGDFVDRGSFSLEVIMTLFAYKLVYPTGLNLTRGNHETKNMNKIYGFEGEVQHKLDNQVMRLFTQCFCRIPLCAVLEKSVFVVHGGLASENDVTLSDINKLDRVREPPESGLMCDLMWADPQAARGRAPSKRGVGLSFGPDVTDNFLDTNDLKLVVRSHEVRDQGYEWEHPGKLVTVFSAPNYCDQMGNKGAYIHFKRSDDFKPKFTTFAHVPHPPVRPMQYANSLAN